MESVCGAVVEGWAEARIVVLAYICQLPKTLCKNPCHATRAALLVRFGRSRPQAGSPLPVNSYSYFNSQHTAKQFFLSFRNFFSMCVSSSPLHHIRNPFIPILTPLVMMQPQTSLLKLYNPVMEQTLENLHENNLNDLLDDTRYGKQCLNISWTLVSSRAQPTPLRISSKTVAFTPSRSRVSTSVNVSSVETKLTATI